MASPLIFSAVPLKPLPVPLPGDRIAHAIGQLTDAIDDLEQGMAGALFEKDINALARIKTLLRPFACQFLALEDSCGDYQNLILKGQS